MHELSIASSIIETVRGEIASRPGRRATAVGVRIGALAAIDADALRFGFDAIVKDSDLEPLRIDIEQIDRRQRCLDCSTEFETDRYTLTCPACGSLRGACIAGEELDITFIEVEEA
ncbi:MAG: hydrogenase maturation nickel metallochaperone HypA [Thermoanaerobaculia bacterium]|nr:hydrogenase maturation nickel metallochaperone HypA [Thermoanaerobaculia bacterium]